MSVFDNLRISGSALTAGALADGAGTVGVADGTGTDGEQADVISTNAATAANQTVLMFF